MEQEKLNNIWNGILNETYKKKAAELSKTFVGELFGSLYVYPEKLHSDVTEDAMSIPDETGTKRRIYVRKKNQKTWEPRT